MWKTKAINRELPPGAGKKKRQRKEEGMAMLFLLPSLLGLVLLSLIPMLISLYISLTDWVYTDGLGNWNFVGLIISALTEPQVWCELPFICRISVTS